MSATVLTPQDFTDASSSWSGESNALFWLNDGSGAQATGSGYLSLKNMAERFTIYGGDAVVGFEVELYARTEGPILVSDSLTDTAGNLLQNHSGELNAVWNKPLTAYNPTDLVFRNSRVIFGFQNEDGLSYEGGEHYLDGYSPPSADYAVEASIHAATETNGETATVYARATQPHQFYFFAYRQTGTGTGVWELGKQTIISDRTVLDSDSTNLVPLLGAKTMRLEARGTSLKGFVDGVEVCSATDSTITGAGYPGLRLDASPDRRGVVVTALWDLGSATTVTRFRRTFGSNNGLSAHGFVIEASSDGSNWVDAWTGSLLELGFEGPTLTWGSELDTTAVTGTPYRYWRVVCSAPGNDYEAVAAIGDFRLYTASGLVTVGGAVVARGGYRTGTTAHNWGEATSTSLFSDNSPGDTSTYLGGYHTTLAQTEGLQFESFRVDRLLPTTLNVYLSSNGSTPNGTAKTLLLTSSNTYRLVGGPTDLFGGSWTVGDVQGANFSILLARAEANAVPFVDAARVIIYHTGSGASLMSLREAVRQQILIGREVGVNAVQTLTITGTPTGGTFRLTFNGVETANIAYNAAAAAVQSALEAISSIGTGNVVCAGGALPGAGVTITFSGSLAATPVSLITVTNAAFTGGTAPAGAVANTTTGVRGVGNNAATTVRLRHARIQPQPAAEFRDHRPAGEKLTNHQLLLKEGAEGPIEGIPTYDEMGWLLQSLIARPATSVLSAGAAFRHVFYFDNRQRDANSSYTCEYGDPYSRAHKVNALIVNALEIGLRQDGMDLGGSIIAQRIQDGITMSPGVATVQTLTQSGSGTFALRFRGQETAALTAGVGLLNTDVQTALRALPFVNSSTQLTVTGSAGGPFTITFGNAAAGPFDGFPQPLLEVRALTGTPTTAVAMTTRGGHTEYEGQVIMPRHVEVYMTPTLASLASSKLTQAFVTNFAMANRATPVYNLDRSIDSWYAYAEPSNIDVSFSLVVEAGSSGMAFLPQGRSDAIMYLRIVATGALIGATAFPHRLQIDCPVKVSNLGQFGENQDVYAFEYGLAGVFDIAQNASLVVTLDNGLANYD